MKMKRTNKLRIMYVSDKKFTDGDFMFDLVASNLDTHRIKYKVLPMKYEIHKVRCLYTAHCIVYVSAFETTRFHPHVLFSDTGKIEIVEPHPYAECIKSTDTFWETPVLVESEYYCTHDLEEDVV